MMDLKHKKELTTNRDYLVNRMGDELLDPRRHGFVVSIDPTKCARCRRPASEHHSWLRRCWNHLARGLRR